MIIRVESGIGILVEIIMIIIKLNMVVSEGHFSPFGGMAVVVFKRYQVTCLRLLLVIDLP